MASITVTNSVNLPTISNFSAPMLSALTAAMGIDRTVLASDQQIATAWTNLPQLLNEVPPELRDEGLMRMCIAVATGLFDSALNYAWNASILQLRQKVRNFGLGIIPQIIDKDFDEVKLLDLRDSELLDLCLKLNLISETGFFMLDQCRDVRNNFSAAHPTIGSVDEYEFISFLNRCTKHALSIEQNATGVDIKELTSAISNGTFAPQQHQIWEARIRGTFDAQRDAVVGMLHGIYCDPSKGESDRVNSLTLSSKVKDAFTPSTRSLLINRHQGYQAKGVVERFTASQAYFEHLQIISLLSDSERHSIISRACKQLVETHQAMDNFYNERPFAERLQQISEGQQIPESVRSEFVEAVVTCSVGNRYGTANSADIHYQRMIKDFSPREIQVMLELPVKNTVIATRVSNFPRCRSKFKDVLKLIQPSSVPNTLKGVYESWLN